MNIKRNISKLVSGLLCFSMIFSNVLPAYAADAVITENTLDGEDLSVNERNLEDITVTYKQASSFFVTIPKTIVLDGWKQSTYAVKVSGDIDAEQCVYVAPVDGIADTENIDFYMKDQASENAKDDVVANVTHNKFHWNSAEVTEGYWQDDNLVSAPDLTAGAWRGIFQMEIKLETHVTHTHNYVETITKEPTCTETGEKTYTCDCGDSYTEEIPAKGHHFEDGECTDCGEKEPDYHKHSYTETITKAPTCTEAGEKTFTCDCGDSYIEVIPAKGHHFVDGECEHCHEKDPCSESHTDENGDNICDICGHEHQWVENEDVLEWVRYNPYNRTDWTKNGNKYEATINIATATTQSASTEFDIEVPNDIEYIYSFTCPILYKTDSLACDNAYLYLYDVDDSGNKISSSKTSIFDVEGTKSGLYHNVSEGKIFLSKGKHKLSVTYRKNNTTKAVSGKVSLTLDPIEIQNHVCTECGEKGAHRYVESITKNATCVENGERKYTCETCRHFYVEEIEATGKHNFVDGICTVCGAGNLVSKTIFSAETSTSQTTDSGHGHWDIANLNGTYSDDIVITNDMGEDEYLQLYFTVTRPNATVHQTDPLSGYAMLQKFNEETNAWNTIYAYSMDFSNLTDFSMRYEEGGGFDPGNANIQWISRNFQLEKGKYRVYGQFKGHVACSSQYSHYYWYYNIKATLCRIEKEVVAPNNINTLSVTYK